MAYIFSTSLPVGFKAPDFQLRDVVSGEMKSLNELKSDIATVVLFICNHCPYVKHVNKGIAKLADDYMVKGVAFVAISSNDAEAFPDDSPEFLKQQAVNNEFKFPYLFDSTQEVAKAYKAACTPDFYVFNGKLELEYHGRMDASNHKNTEPNDGKDIRNALEKVIKGQPTDKLQTPSSGCNIKWKAGVSPF